MHAAAVRDRIEDFGDVDVVLVTFTDAQKLLAYIDQRQAGFPVVTDPDREAYRAFGLGRGSIPRVWGWRPLKRYVEIIREHGFSAIQTYGKATEDTQQLGGDFIIDPDGRLVYGYWSEGPDDRPGVDDLLAALSAT